jgi:RNA polymerase sigma-70 factor (ECF subfamily)
MASPQPIASLLEIGRLAWPALVFEPAGFAEHVSALTIRRGLPLVAHAADLYLAYACAVRAPGACEAFDAVYRETLARAAARAAKSDEVAEEAAQILRVKLFVHDPPKILDYGGRAKLSTWLASAAARTALNVIASGAARVNEPLETGRFLARADPELDCVRARYAGHFEPALVAALSGLTERNRTMLRLHIAERMTIDALATVYGVDRSTTARWIAAAREALLSNARRELQERLGVTPSELRSIGAAFASKLEVSLMGLL